jgi:hypothetical protein
VHNGSMKEVEVRNEVLNSDIIIRVPKLPKFGLVHNPIDSRVFHKLKKNSQIINNIIFLKPSEKIQWI